MEVEIVYNNESQTDSEDLGKVYDRLTEKILAVYEIFKDYFGADRTDLQELKNKEEYISTYRDYVSEEENLYNNYDPNDLGAKIMVWFPEVKVTNESGKSVTIYDLYAKINIDCQGQLKYLHINRTTYPMDQWSARYIHSHLPRLMYNSGSIKGFHTPCLGSGPLYYTLGRIRNSCNPDFWLLFCSELEDYVTVESLSGGPYIRMEEIGEAASTDLHASYYNASSWSLTSGYAQIYAEMLQDFTRFLLKDKIPVEYANGSYSIGIPFIQFMLMVSDKFVFWYNQKHNPYRSKFDKRILKANSILVEYVLRGDSLFEYNPDEDSYTNYDGMDMFIFKGTMLKLKIIKKNSDESNRPLLLNIDIVKGIASAILHVLNFKYGRKQEEDSVFNRKTIYI